MSLVYMYTHKRYNCNVEVTLVKCLPKIFKSREPNFTRALRMYAKWRVKLVCQSVFFATAVMCSQLNPPLTKKILEFKTQSSQKLYESETRALI